MKTFKSATSKLELRVVRTNEGLVRLNIGSQFEAYASIDISPDSIPALALAELEAAGYDASQGRVSNIGHAMHWLKLELSLAEARATEAKEQAELEAEGLALFNTQVRALGDDLELQSLDEMHGLAKESWLAVARKAREMRAEK